jgi:hypothetical protein
MQTITRAVLAIGLFTCVVVSIQAASAKPGGVACQVVSGACVSVKCGGECGPAFPATCTCLR